MWVCRNVMFTIQQIDGWNPTNKDGDDWGIVYYCYTNIIITSIGWLRISGRHQSNTNFGELMYNMTYSICWFIVSSSLSFSVNHCKPMKSLRKQMHIFSKTDPNSNSGWWFGTCFPFSRECPPPNWRTLIFFRGMAQPTTNQNLLINHGLSID